MKPLRILYSAVLVLSLATAALFYWQYHLQNRELAQYQQLTRSFSKAVTKLSKELNKSLKEREKLNSVIAALEKEKSGFKGELQALKEERTKLEAKIIRLVEEKTTLETEFLSLVQKFHSLEELKKAIRIAKKEHYQRSKIERIQRRLAKIEMLQRLDEIALQQGNRGYLVRQGSSTFEPRIRVELEPVGEWSYREEEIENK